jgi:hypothetical protein
MFMLWISLLLLMVLVAAAPGIVLAVEQRNQSVAHDTSDGFNETSHETL